MLQYNSRSSPTPASDNIASFVWHLRAHNDAADNYSYLSMKVFGIVCVTATRLLLRSTGWATDAPVSIMPPADWLGSAQ